ncbi:MAG: Wzz/FepE/Etk N-terminal domain-containing protein [Gemmataceae bacterium]
MPESPSVAERASAEELVRGMLSVLGRHKLLIGIGLLLGGAVAAGLYLVTPPAYASSAQLWVNKKRGEGLGVESRESQEDYLATQQGLLKSPLMIDKAIQLGALAERPNLKESGKDLSESILKNFSVSRQKDSMGAGTNILSLGYRARVPDDADAVLEAVIKAYRQTLADLAARSTGDVRELFAQARDGLHKELLDKERTYHEFRKQSPLIWRGRDGVNPHQERLANLEPRYAGIVVRQAETKARLDALEEAIKTNTDRNTLLSMASEFSAKPELEGVKQSQVSRWQEQVLLLVQQEAKLLEKLGPDHPEVAVVRQSIAAAREFLNRPATAASDGVNTLETKPTDPVQSCIQSLRQELEYLKSAESLVGRLCKLEREEARKLSGFEVEDEMHRNDLQRTQQMFEALLKRLQDANLGKEVGGLELTVIAEPGSDGVKKVQPSKILFGVGGMVMGLMFASGLVGLAEFRNRRFRGSEEAHRVLQLPILGRIPTVLAKSSQPRQLLVIEASPTSAEAEAFRGLRTALLAGLGGDSHRVLQVVSARSSEGKTTAAANLAVALAQAGRRVALIEGNLAAPKLGGVFDKFPPSAMLAVLRGGLQLEQALIESGIPGLWLLPVEQRVSPAGDLLASSEFRSMIEALRERFDVILIDGSPILQVADSMTLAACTDGAILALSLARTERSDALRAAEMLRDVRTPILGLACMDAPPEETFGGK